LIAVSKFSYLDYDIKKLNSSLSSEGESSYPSNLFIIPEGCSPYYSRVPLQICDDLRIYGIFTYHPLIQHIIERGGFWEFSINQTPSHSSIIITVITKAQQLP
jgi:hypothetical protein